MHRNAGPSNWKLTQMQKLQKACRQPNGRMDRRTDTLYCHSGDLNLWPAAACAAGNYGPRFYDYQKAMRKTRQRDRETDI